MAKSSINRRARIQDLKTHTAPYVTVSELADYWLVSRKLIYKQIEAGTLHTIKLGPRLLRIRTAEALDFERRANMHRPTRDRGKSASAGGSGVANHHAPGPRR